MPRLTRTHRLALYGGFSALIYFVGLGAPALWEPDEGRYAEIARAMAVGGDYVTPRDDGVRYLEKPPLLYWSEALAIRALGRNEFAVRVPSALASAGSVVVTAAAAELMLGSAVCLLAALALGLSPLFFLFARAATPDPELAFFFSAALIAFYAAAGRDFRSGEGRCLMITAAALTALATLVKGPVALVLEGAIALLWLVGEGRWREAARIRWPECVAVYLALAVPWFVFAARRNPGFVEFFFMHEHLQRFVSDTEHGWGPWFFAAVAVFGTWPFFYFVPSGIAALASRATGSESFVRRSALRFLLLWFAVVILFFSVPRSKLAEYLLPGLPPLAILAAAGLDLIPRMEPHSAWRLVRGFATINVTIAIGGFAMMGLLRYLGKPPTGAAFAWFNAPNASAAMVSDASLLLVCIGVVSVVLWVQALRWGRSPAGTPIRRMPYAVALLALLIVAALGKARSDATPIFSYRPLAQAIAPRLEQGCVMASYHHFVQGLPFYTGHQEQLVGYRGELAPFGDSPDAAGVFIASDARLQQAWSSPSCMILIVNRGDWARLATVLKPPPSLVACEGKKVAITNQDRGVLAPLEAGACGGASAPRN
jgi:4-amino-4-deoxy-L-arabinose transferase-like glycosyltransferase